jgi:hypothetical protein
MKRINHFYQLSLIVLAGLATACQKKAEPFTYIVEGEITETTVTTADSLTYIELDYPQVANLDQAPKDKDGFISLFNGVDFNGWRGYGKDRIPGKWIIEDGAIKVRGSGQGEAHTTDGGDIIFAYRFKNFELLFDWKVSPNANSGVLYLAREIKGQPIWISSPEYQVLDNAGHPDALLGENGNRKSASLYDMIPADPQNAKPAGEWNQGGVMVYKGTVVHKQNGKNVLEYHLWTPKWNELIAQSKFKPGGDFPLAYGLLTQLGGEAHEGYIGLQDHGDDVWYKNIRIKILE